MASPAPEINRMPATGPAELGEKSTFKVTLCPGPRAYGNVGPLTENPAPDVWRAKRFTFHGRAFVRTMGLVDTVPNAELPKVTVEGLAVTITLLTPEPATSSGKIVLAVSLINLIVPPSQPILVGVKLTLISTL
jgi:hypothetical protein